MTGDNRFTLTTPWAILLAGCVVAGALLISGTTPQPQVGRYVPVAVWEEREQSGYGPARKGHDVYIVDTVTGNRR